MENVTVQPCSSISPLRGFSAATQLQISLMAERHMPGIKIIALCEQAHSRNYLDFRRMAELLLENSCTEKSTLHFHKKAVNYKAEVLSNRQYDDENSRMWSVSERTAGFDPGWKRFYTEADEDHLRVALIQPGSSRYLRNEVVIFRQESAGS